VALHNSSVTDLMFEQLRSRRNFISWSSRTFTSAHTTDYLKLGPDISWFDNYTQWDLDKL
jgi:hypothetical protein